MNKIKKNFIEKGLLEDKNMNKTKIDNKNHSKEATKVTNNNFSGQAQNQATSKNELKEILTEALLGKQDPKTSIEQLSSVLFPEEDLIDAVNAMKIKQEFSLRLEGLKKKANFVMSDITRNGNLYSINLNFNDTKSFSLVQHNIGEIAAHISKKYSVDVQPNMHISQTFACYKKENPSTDFILPDIDKDKVKSATK